MQKLWDSEGFENALENIEDVSRGRNDKEENFRLYVMLLCAKIYNYRE